MNQDTYGDFLGYQESPGMTFDLTGLNKTWFQEVTFHKKKKTRFWQKKKKTSRYSPFTLPIQNLGSTQVKSTSKIIIIDVKNSSFGYDLTIGNLVKRGHYHCCSRTPWFLKCAPWRRVLRTIWPHETPRNLISRSRNSQNSQEFDWIVADGQHWKDLRVWLSKVPPPQKCPGAKYKSHVLHRRTRPLTNRGSANRDHKKRTRTHQKS